MGQPITEFDEPVIAEAIVPLFYESRNYQPAWPDHDYAQSVLQLLALSEVEGLNKESYHYSALVKLTELMEAAGYSNAFINARFDVLLTDGLLIYALHLRDGKVNASELESSWNYSQLELLPEQTIDRLTGHIDTQTVAEGLEGLKPRVPYYEPLKESLAHYTRLANERPFETIPDQHVLRVGDNSDSIILLRQRMSDLGLLPKNNDSPVFDQELLLAVLSFQRRHGLDSDGIVGSESFTQLNVPYRYRADQIRINLDRVRWISNDISSDFVLVNIAGFKVRLIRGGEEIWTSDVMTGAVSTETPMFKSSMTYLVFNPTWTVPRSIAARSLIPAMKANPGYAAKNDYQLIGRDGVAVDPLALDWNTLGPDYFPYTIVQQPGVKNALGQIKFMFPNGHAIYLHDTPSRHLFVKSQRAFSAGCIRVNNPMVLARLLLNDSERWNDEAIEATVQKRELMNVRLAKPIDVLLMYWTINFDADGKTGFSRDIYNRDADLLAAFHKKLF
jgi:murein L,D-transpeptidase YcbB/YkuD